MQHPGRWLLAILSVCIITPFTNDIYIASLSEIGEVFQTSNTQLVMSSGLLGLSLSQLVYGPLSDRYGRKPVLLVGLAIFTIASLAVTLAPSYEALLIARFFQAVGACSTTVSALAIARDYHSGDDLVRAVSLVMMMIAVCPCIAPIVGSGLQAYFGWQASFLYLFVLGVIYLMIIGFGFQESLKEPNHEATQISRLAHNYLTLLKHPHYLGYTLTSSLSYATLFSVLTVSHLILHDLLGLGHGGFSAAMGFNAVILVGLSKALPSLKVRYGLQNILLAGTLLIALGGALLFALASAFGASLYTVLPALTVIYCGIGLIRPSASAGAMHIFGPRIAGSAAAMFTFFSFIGGALVTVYAGYAIRSGLGTFGLLVLAMGIAAAASASLCRRPEPSRA